jgi:tetratricopeptide (TPR) repeat protein
LFSELLTLSFFALLSLTQDFAAAPGNNPAQASAHADKGMRMLSDGNLQGAEAEFRLAVELDPQSGVYPGSLGAVLGMERKLVESNAYLERALDINPDDWASRRNLASNQFQLGQLQAAKENLERVRKAKPGDETVRLLLGMVAEESKDYRAAVAAFESVPDQVRQRPESMLALARSYYNVGQKDKARQALKDLLALGRAERRFPRPRRDGAALGRSRDPVGTGAPLAPTSALQDWQNGLFAGGQTAAQAGDYETAEQVFAAISATYPDTAKLGYNLALAQYHAGHIERSQATLRKLLDTGHDTDDIENLTAWCLYKQGRIKEAVASMDRAIGLQPGKESHYLDMGMMLVEQRRYQGTLLAAQKAVEIAPDSYQAWRLKGLAEAKLDRIKDAGKSYQRAVELNPSDEQSILGLASERLNDGQIDEAKETFEQGIQRLPRDAALYQAYGSVLVWLQGAGTSSDEARAASLLQTALRLDPSLAGPHYQLGKLALRKGQIAGALQELETANRLEPKSSQTHYQLALVYRKLGRTEEATRELQAFKTLKAEDSMPALGKPIGGSTATLTEETPRLEGPSQR